MEWKECPGFPGYEVSAYGDVRRLSLIRPFVSDGYLKVSLRKGGRSYNVFAHRLVAQAFLGPPPFEGAEACHKDGTRTKNHYRNLRWDTRLGNMADKAIHGTAHAKLTARDVLEIRELIAAGFRYCQIAPKYNVDVGTISKIKRRETWAHLNPAA